jgi:thiosulfate/3-mercaptopyruvate sulfurtransferase
MAFTTLIDTTTLAGHLDTADWVIVDCRFRLDDPAWGEREYLSTHIPGAVYAHLDRDLSGPMTGTNGRHPLPDVTALTDTFGRLGIGSGVQVVAYDQDAGSYASRLWWMLRWMGHGAAAVLDGGFARWRAEGRPVEPGRHAPSPRVFTRALRREMAVTADEVAALLQQPETRLVDARAPERYRGEVETVDKVAGHIAGASNLFYRWNLNDQGTFRSPAELRALWAPTLAGTAPEQVVCYCGSGVTACHDLLALEHAGLSGARLYPGSWSEWSSDPSRPITTAAPAARRDQP